MKILRSRVNAQGKRELVVTLDAGEELLGILDRTYYRLGGQIDDVVGGHVLTESAPVYWCGIEQKWVDT